jgi:signal transduction histidine kinase
VQFYESEAFLVDIVGAFLDKGLHRGEGLAVIATKEHWKSFRRALQVDGLALMAAEQEGRIRVLDASEVLGQLLTEGSVDARAFHRILEVVIAEVQARVAPRGVRIYGEIVNLLWQQGKTQEALALERLWNELLQRHPASLLCAYQMDGVHAGEHAAAVGEVCDLHVCAAPAESIGLLQSSADRQRGLIVLQHCARSLEQEIEERKTAEEALRRRDAELVEVDRHKDEFLALLGHELRNPMAAITSALHVMRAGGPDSAARAQGVIERQIAKMARLIDDLLDVSRIRHGKMTLEREVLSLGGLVGRAIEGIRATIESRSQHLLVTLPPEPVWVNGDPVRLEQVLANLLLNASRYTPAGGRIAVRACLEAGEVAIIVEDDGQGMSPELVERLFEPFVQGQPCGSSPDGGLGLGLSLVRGILALHGGRVEARSEGPGRGSTFLMWLPVNGTSLSRG